MRLQTRLGVALAATMGVLFVVAATLDYRHAQARAETEALREARNFYALLMSVRRVYHHAFLDAGIPLTDKTLGLLPAHALARISADFAHWSRSGLRFNNVSDRPRNPRNRADADELRAMAWFRAHPDAEERLVTSERGGAWYLYTRPIWIEQYCLKCHGRREDAPPTIRERYDTAYDYQVGDLRGLVSIHIPRAAVMSASLASWRNDLLLFTPVWLLGWALIHFWMRRLLLRRIDALTGAVQRIEQGEARPPLALSGNDELDRLGSALLTMARAVDDRQRALERGQRLYRLLSDVNQMLIRRPDPARAVMEVCRLAMDSGLFPLVQVWVWSEDRRAWRPLAPPGQARPPVEGLPPSLAKHLPEGPDETGLVIDNDLAARPGAGPWLAAGLAAVAVAPFTGCGVGPGRLVIYAAESGFFVSDSLALVREMAEDLSFALESHRLAQEHRRTSERLDYLTFNDPLTGLLNREGFLDRLGQALARMRRHGGRGGLLHLDLDGFKHINDTLGSPTGDRLLQRVAADLKASLRAEDLLARPVGDEFLVLLEAVDEEPRRVATETQRVALKLQQALDHPYAVDGHEVRVGCCIGLSLFPVEDEGLEVILDHAAIALHRAKADGRGRVRFYRREDQVAVRERLALEQDLRKALEAGDFAPFIQPQVDAAGRLRGAEALMRWRRDGTWTAPGTFIGALEDTGLIVPVGYLILERACALLAGWQRAGRLPAGFRLSVNLSPSQLHRADCARRIDHVLARTGADPQLIELEITEASLVRSPEEAAAILQGLRELGMTVAIDDFGTGYSSLAYLAHLPLDRIKIDQGFVARMGREPRVLALVETIVSVAARLDLEVVAEGVETREQLETLKGLGCERFQGYLFARPMEPEAFAAGLPPAA